MAIALVGDRRVRARRCQARAQDIIAAPIRACGTAALLTMGVVALLYNWGFFTMLGLRAVPDGTRRPLQLGLVFAGWGCWSRVPRVRRPRLQARFGTAPGLYVNLGRLGIVMASSAIG